VASVGRLSRLVGCWAATPRKVSLHVTPVWTFSIRPVVDEAEGLACGRLGNLLGLAGKLDTSRVVVRDGDDHSDIGELLQR
jgi:hypothetical protein